MKNNTQNESDEEPNIEDTYSLTSSTAKKQKTDDITNQAPLMENFSLAGFTFAQKNDITETPKFSKNDNFLSFEKNEELNYKFFEKSPSGKLVFCGGPSFLDQPDENGENRPFLDQNLDLKTDLTPELPPCELGDPQDEMSIIPENSVISIRCKVWELEKESNKYRECGPCQLDLTDIPDKNCSKIVICSLLNGRLLANSLIWRELAVWIERSGGLVLSTFNSNGTLVFHYIASRGNVGMLENAISERIRAAPGVGSSDNVKRDEELEEDVTDEEVEEVDLEESEDDLESYEEIASDEVIVISSGSEHDDLLEEGRSEDESSVEVVSAVEDEINSITDDSHSMDAFYTAGKSFLEETIENERIEDEQNVPDQRTEIFESSENTDDSNMDITDIGQPTETIDSERSEEEYDPVNLYVSINQDIHVGESTPTEVESHVEENICTEVDSHVEENIRTAVDSHAGENMPTEVDSYVRENMRTEVDSHLGENMPMEVNSHVGENMPMEVDSHVGENMPMEVDRHVGENMPMEVDRHVGENMHMEIDTECTGQLVMEGTVSELSVYVKKYGPEVWSLCRLIDRGDSSRLVVTESAHPNHIVMDHVITDSTLARSTGNKVIMSANKPDGSLGIFKISMLTVKETNDFYDAVVQRVCLSAKHILEDVDPSTPSKRQARDVN